jgi:hypothetical protein
MSNHKVISILITNLTINEVNSFHRDLSHRTDVSSKLLKMFKLIRKNKICDQDEVIKALYENLDKNSIESYRKLCERMLNKLLNIIVSFENFKLDKNNYSEYYFNKVLVNRNIHLIEVLKIKMLPIDWMIKQVQITLKICDEFEFVEEGIVMEKNNLLFHYAVGDLNKIEVCYQNLKRRAQYLLYLNKAEVYIYKHIDQVQHKSIDDKSRISDIQFAILDLEEYYNATSLQSINFIVLMLRLQLAHYEEKYELAEQIILDIIRISDQYSALKKRSKLMQNYMNLAYTQFYLNKYEEAYLNALKATKEYIEKDLVLNNYREACVFALIYLNRYTEAEGWIAKMLSSGIEGNNPEQLSKRHLMMGVLKYLQNDFKGAFKHLQFTKEVETDREGWNLGIRMLNIYLTLSTEKVDLADQRINAMRKHIERTSKMRNLRKRDIIIFRILSHLSRSGFDFKETWEERKKDFALLRSKTPDCFWVPRSHELIIFDQWFEAKMNNIPYAPIFPSPQQDPEKAVDISAMEEA